MLKIDKTRETVVVIIFHQINITVTVLVLITRVMEYFV